MKRAAVSMVEREDGRILCVWNKRYGGWAMPGGLVEEDETPEEAQRRELLEETGLHTASRSKIFEGEAVRLPGGENRASYVHVFRVDASGVAQEREVGCAVTWLTRDEFLRWSPFAAMYAPIFSAKQSSDYETIESAARAAMTDAWLCWEEVVEASKPEAQAFMAVATPARVADLVAEARAAARLAAALREVLSASCGCMGTDWSARVEAMVMRK